MFSIVFKALVPVKLSIKRQFFRLVIEKGSASEHASVGPDQMRVNSLTASTFRATPGPGWDGTQALPSAYLIGVSTMSCRSSIGPNTSPPKGTSGSVVPSCNAAAAAIEVSRKVPMYVSSLI